MKKFLSGVLCATLVFSLALSALAISGRMTIEVDPINVQINGEVFQPTDVNGKEVPVFAYQGTTYAPLRALAEAYGLEVGYNVENNIATVNTKSQSKKFEFVPSNVDSEYQEFLNLWNIESSENGEWLFLVPKDTNDAHMWRERVGADRAHDQFQKFAIDAEATNGGNFLSILVIESGSDRDESFFRPYSTVIMVNR